MGRRHLAVGPFMFPNKSVTTARYTLYGFVNSLDTWNIILQNYVNKIEGKTRNKQRIMLT